jgi:hypothetical protein
MKPHTIGLSCARERSRAALCKLCHRRERVIVRRLGHWTFLKVCRVCQDRLQANASACPRKPKRRVRGCNDAGADCYTVTGPAGLVLARMNSVGGW